MNGIGERTGNANLMTIIPTLQLKMGAPGVEGNLRNLTALSRFTDELVSVVIKCIRRGTVHVSCSG